MNFYKRYPGDYLRDTPHLSLAEHGAFCLMLDYFYSNEKPLPKGRELYRLLRAFTAKERRQIDSVLDQFWTETDDGYVNEKALKIIAEMRKKSDASRENGAKGGRPPKPKEEPKPEPSENLLGYFQESQEKASRHQTPDYKRATHPRPPPGVDHVIGYMQGQVADHENLAKVFFTTYETTGWIYKGDPILNWKALAMKWILTEKDHAKRRRTSGSGRKESPSERGARIAREILESEQGGATGNVASPVQ